MFGTISGGRCGASGDAMEKPAERSRRLVAASRRMAGAATKRRPVRAPTTGEASPLSSIRPWLVPARGSGDSRRRPIPRIPRRTASTEENQDPLVAEYGRVVQDLTAKIRVHRDRLRKAKRLSTRKRLRRTLYTLYVNRGQIRRTLEYMNSHERYVTPLPSGLIG